MRLTLGALHSSLQTQAGEAVLTLEGPDECLLRTSGKGALIPMAPAAQPRAVVTADLIAHRPREAGPAAYLAPDLALDIWLAAGQQDLSRTVVFHLMQDVSALIEALGATGTAQAEVHLGIEPGQRQPLGGRGVGR
jgi:hypothetical protein